MRTFVVLAVLAACGGGGDDGLGFPVNPGGGGGGTGSSSTPDAAIDDVDGGTTVAGRVCLLSDGRTPMTCAGSGVAGFTVAVGGVQATTLDDGSFVIARPSGSNLVWRVSGAGIVPSAMRYSATATLIPAIETNLYDDMVSATSPTVELGQGAIIAQVTNGTTPVANIAAATSPLTTSGIYSDGLSAVDWDPDAVTGSFGALWIPGIDPGSISLTLDDGSAAPPVISNIPIFADTLTFVLYELP